MLTVQRTYFIECFRCFFFIFNFNFHDVIMSNFRSVWKHLCTYNVYLLILSSKVFVFFSLLFVISKSFVLINSYQHNKLSGLDTFKKKKQNYSLTKYIQKLPNFLLFMIF